MLALLAGRDSSGCLIGRTVKCVRETQTLKLSQLFSGAKDVSALLPLELDIYYEWIAKEIERKLAKDAQIVKSADWCLEKGSV